MKTPRGLVLLKNLRNGKKMTCHACNKGTIIPVGDYKTTRVFLCDKCDYRITID